jgi:hypothetical protein
LRTWRRCCWKSAEPIADRPWRRCLHVASGRPGRRYGRAGRRRREQGGEHGSRCAPDPPRSAVQHAADGEHRCECQVRGRQSAGPRRLQPLVESGPFAPLSHSLVAVRSRSDRSGDGGITRAWAAGQAQRHGPMHLAARRGLLDPPGRAIVDQLGTASAIRAAALGGNAIAGPCASRHTKQ